MPLIPGFAQNVGYDTPDSQQMRCSWNLACSGCYIAADHSLRPTIQLQAIATVCEAKTADFAINYSNPEKLGEACCLISKTGIDLTHH